MTFISVTTPSTFVSYNSRYVLAELMNDPTTWSPSWATINTSNDKPTVLNNETQIKDQSHQGQAENGLSPRDK